MTTKFIRISKIKTINPVNFVANQNNPDVQKERFDECNRQTFLMNIYLTVSPIRRLT
jgi:hypothetical protein